MSSLESKIEVLQRITGDVYNDSELIALLDRCKNKDRNTIGAYCNDIAHQTSFNDVGAGMIYGAVLALLYLDELETEE